MPKGLKRHYGQGDLHFITFCCYHRRRYLKTVRARNLFLKILGEVRRKYQFRLIGYVLMPEHVHLLISEPKKGNVSLVLAGLEAASLTSDARKKEAGSERAALFKVPRSDDAGPPFLAEAFLRLQRVERCKKERKTALYARESSDGAAGEASERLAVEQFLILCER